MTSARQIYLGSRRGPALPYDAEVEYIESTGTQWIDTGIAAREGLIVECTGNILQYAATVYLFGCVGGSRTQQFGVYTNAQDSKYVYIAGAVSGLYTTSVLIGKDRHIFVIDTTAGAKTFSVDGSIEKTWDTSLGVTLSNIFLFARSDSSYTSASRMYSFSIKDAATGQMLLDLVPVRTTNALGECEGAMYDRVSGEIFRNQGTGAFGFGTDIAGGGYKWLGCSPLRFSRFSRLWKEAA